VPIQLHTIKLNQMKKNKIIAGVYIVITTLFLVTMFSSCSVRTHTTADGQRWKSAGKNHHYQSKNGVITRESGVPACVRNWSE
tara:strand:- start:7833 stop:8081 length:249 start_codon:yes stop_codon:yes gene_type:complete